MKHLIFVLVLSIALKGLAQKQSPQELAREIAAAFDAGRAKSLMPNMKSNIAILSEAVETYPEDATIHFALGTCYMMQENKAMALRSLEKAYRYSNKNPQYGSAYALALKMNQQLDQAYRVSKELVEAHPQAPRLQIGLAVLDVTIQKYDEALSILDPLLRRAPKNLPGSDKATLLLMRGTCQLYKGQHQEAIRSLEESLSNFTNSAVIMNVLGHAYLKAGRVEQAQVMFDKTLKINPRIPSALFYRGLGYERAGQAAAAKKCFEDSYAFGKQRLDDNGENTYLMVMVCEKLSRPDEAAKYRKEAADLMFTYDAPWQKK
jgi:tetratricopeptide (TPR) repeat protein